MGTIGGKHGQGMSATSGIRERKGEGGRACKRCFKFLFRLLEKWNFFLCQMFKSQYTWFLLSNSPFVTFLHPCLILKLLLLQCKNLTLFCSTWSLITATYSRQEEIVEKLNFAKIVGNNSISSTLNTGNLSIIWVNFDSLKITHA